MRYSQIKTLCIFPVVVCDPLLVYQSVIRIVHLRSIHGCTGIYRNGVHLLKIGRCMAEGSVSSMCDSIFLRSSTDSTCGESIPVVASSM